MPGRVVPWLMTSFDTTLTDYCGWLSFRNNLNFITEELKNPYVTLPRAIIIGIPLVIMCYLCVNVAYLTILSPESIVSSAAVAVVFDTLHQLIQSAVDGWFGRRSGRWKPGTGSGWISHSSCGGNVRSRWHLNKYFHGWKVGTVSYLTSSTDSDASRIQVALWYFLSLDHWFQIPDHQAWN